MRIPDYHALVSVCVGRHVCGRMSFAKSPRVVRSGANTSVVAPQVSGRVVSESEQSNVVSPKSSTGKAPRSAVPVWAAVLLLSAVLLHLVSYVLAYMEFSAFLQMKDFRHLLGEEMSGIGWALAFVPLSTWVVTIELIGLAVFVASGIFVAYKFEIGKGLGAFLLDFTMALLYTVNLQVYRKWARSNTTVDGDHVEFDSGAAAKRWWIFVAGVVLVSLVAALATTRTRAWSHFESHSVAVAFKISTALSVLGFGMAPVIGVVSRTPAVAVWVSAGGLGLLTVMLVATTVVNWKRERQIAASAAEKQALLTLDHTTETI